MVAALVWLLATATAAPSMAGEPGVDAKDQMPVTREDAVARVLALDPRFSDLADWGELWRHSWYYRVDPAGDVTLLFEEGDPDQGAGAKPATDRPLLLTWRRTVGE